MKQHLPVGPTYDDDPEFFAVGGPEFERDTTTHISAIQWHHVYDAMAFSLRQGIVMNVHITMVWGHFGIYNQQQASERMKAFCAAMRHRARECNWPFAYAYAHENTRDQGHHTHLLTSWQIADRDDFEGWAEYYARTRIARNLPFHKEGIVVRHRKDNDVVRHWMWFGYITKATHPEYRFRDLVDRHKWYRFSQVMLRHYEDGGKIHCRKRVGVSRNIDGEARRLAGFRSTFVLGANTKEELYTDAELQGYQDEQRSIEFQHALGSLSLDNQIG